MKTRYPTLLTAWSLLCALSSARADTVSTWIGGDQSLDGNSMQVAGNWDNGLAPTTAGTAATNAFRIVTDGDYAKWTSSNSSIMHLGQWTIGDAETNPGVTVEFISTRYVNGDLLNDNASTLSFLHFSACGSNTVITVHKGLCLSLQSTAQGWGHALAPEVRLTGNGAVNFNSLTLPGRDFDNLDVTFSESVAASQYVLAGDVSTRGTVTISATGSAGVDGTATFNLNGHRLSGGTLRLGTTDMRPEDGNQSGFAVLRLAGGELVFTGDLITRSDPLGTRTDGSALTTDSAIIGGGLPASITLGGSFDVNSVRPDLWNLSTVDLTLDGDGTAVQTLEVMSADRGVQATATQNNYAWRNVTLGAGASVRLADAYDNRRDDGGAPEVLYCGDLTLGPGAVLDLAGHTVYCYGTVSVDATAMVTENGGAIVAAPASLPPVQNTIFPVGLFDATAGVGQWVGPATVGDFDNDGLPELLFQATDEDVTDEDGGIFAYRYRNGALTALPGFPIRDGDFRAKFGAATYMFPYNLRIADLGTGRGNEALFGHGDAVYALNAAGDVRTVIAGRSHTYAQGVFSIGDIDRDGHVEMATCGRNASGANATVWRFGDSGEAEALFSAAVPADNGIVAMSAFVDVTGDRRPEILFAPSGDGRESASARRGISVFSPDGSPVTSALDPSLVLTNIFFNSKMGEGPGAFSAADFTGDGIPEFFLCSARDNTGHFTVIDQLGETLLTVSSISANGFALLDVDYDGDYEALYGPTLYDWVDGAAVAADTLPNPSATSSFVPYAAPVLADFTGNGIPEAVYITAPNTVPGNRYGRDICVYNFVTGEMLPGFPISLANPDATSQYWGMGQLGRWTATVPLVADLDGDGFWEIFAAAGSWYNREAQPFQAYLNIIDTPYAVPPSTFSAAELGWTLNGHDVQNSSTYPRARPLPTILLLH